MPKRTTKRVNHDVAEEFALYFADRTSNYNATVDLLTQARPNGSRAAGTRLAALSFEPDEVNRNQMVNFRVLYAA